MSLKEIDLKRAYSSDTDDILESFYIPALQASVEYRRLAGLFSSASLAVAARGILGLIQNGGVMKLIACPKLTKEDVEAIVEAQQNPTTYLAQSMLRELEEMDVGFVQDHVRALGWMVANQRLEIKLCLPYDKSGRPHDHESISRAGIFHQKVGLLTDREGNQVTFSGSVNETASGWLGNIEEFKVFRSWEPLEREYQDADITKFARFWEGNSPKVRTFSVPEAVRERLVSLASDDIENEALRRWSINVGKPKRKRVKLFEHQEQAVQAWLDHDKTGIFQMATGTGKTLAALGCLRRIADSTDRLVAVVTCPYSHLIHQWREQITRFGISCDVLHVADSTNPRWKESVAGSLADMVLGYTKIILILATHATFASEAFRDIMGQHADELPMLLIADEVHGLGAPGGRQGLLPEYDYRLGLSATPVRLFDLEGTEAIESYFGGTVYEFPLEQAINTINPDTGKTYLVPYRYAPHFVSLNDAEIENYYRQTEAIARRYAEAKDEDERKRNLELLLFRRAQIIKDAEAKYQCLAEILDDLGPQLNWTLIYCSPGQIDRVMTLVSNRGLVAHRFTMDEGTKPEARYGGASERDFLLRNFQETNYNVLVAMRCLDEGVDVPAARCAILMASSQNPREYVQRIGRILRPCAGKHEADVHDVVVVPSMRAGPQELRDVEEKVLARETARCEHIARSAANRVAALSAVYQVRERLLEGR